VNRRYRDLFLVPGSVEFSFAGLVGRLPNGMLSIAVILLVSDLTGSYSAAGTVAGFTVLGNAVGAPLIGRMVDRRGQRTVLLIFTGLHVGSLCGLLLAARLDAPLSTLCLAGALAGASRASVGTMIRMRWTHEIRSSQSGFGRATVQSAYAFESVVDELVFISGPVIVAAIAVGVDTGAALVACMLLTAIGSIWLAELRRTEPPASPQRPGSRAAALESGMLVVAGATVCIGVSAGAVELAVLARAESIGHRPLGGLLLAVLAVSSMVGGLWYGGRNWAAQPRLRWLLSVLLLACTLLLLNLASTIWLLALVLLLVGFAVAPSGIAAIVLLEKLLASEKLNEAMSLEITAMTVGMALGGWLSGLVTERWGAQTALAAPGLSVLLAVAIIALGYRALRTRDDDRPEQAAALLTDGR
jgi:predicted MFS family arabinose efflux permease